MHVGVQLAAPVFSAVVILEHLNCYSNFKGQRDLSFTLQDLIDILTANPVSVLLQRWLYFNLGTVQQAFIDYTHDLENSLSYIKYSFFSSFHYECFFSNYFYQSQRFHIFSFYILFITWLQHYLLCISRRHSVLPRVSVFPATYITAIFRT